MKLSGKIDTIGGSWTCPDSWNYRRSEHRRQIKHTYIRGSDSCAQFDIQNKAVFGVPFVQTLIASELYVREGKRKEQEKHAKGREEFEGVCSG